MGTSLPGLRKHYEHFVHGKWMPPRQGKYFPSIDPSTGSPIAEFAMGAQEDIDDAVASACEGFARWRARAPAERARILHRISDLISLRATELARLESIDSG